VSRIELPVDEDSIPLHLVGKEPATTELEVARFIAAEPALWQRYNPWLLTLHPSAWQEVRSIMARASRREFTIDLRPAIDELGLEYVIQQIGIEQVVEQIGMDRLIDQINAKKATRRRVLDRLLDTLSTAERRELKRRLEGEADSGG
jgi:hypothetical protein